MSETETQNPAPAAAVVVETPAEVVAAVVAAVPTPDLAALTDAEQASEQRAEGTGPGVTAADPGLPDPKAETEKACAVVAELNPVIDEKRAAMQKLQAELDELNAVKDVHLDIIERHKVHLNHAESVKRIQAQTQATAAKTKERMLIAADALKAAGVNVFPSKLDQAMATRKPSQENKANMAQFIHQQAADRNAARTGNAA